MIEHCARETVWWWPVEFIPAGEQRAQGAIFRPPLLEHPLGQRRGNKCERDPFVGQPSQKLSRREPGLFIRDVDAGATRQIGPQLPDVIPVKGNDDQPVACSDGRNYDGVSGRVFQPGN